jgi:guanylate kinase
LKEEGCGLVLIVSAPSGAGKTTLIRRVMDQLGGLHFSVSYTTRPPRSNEVEGRDYHFVTADCFEKMVEREEFLEWAEVLGNRYGTRKPDLEGLTLERTDLVLDIDTQGAKKVLDQVGQAVSVFILPPSPEALRERLVRRGLDASEVIERRLANARKEIEEAHRYHYVILNDGIEDAVEAMKAIVLAERCRKRKESIFREKKIEWEAYYGKNYR